MALGMRRTLSRMREQGNCPEGPYLASKWGSEADLYVRAQGEYLKGPLAEIKCQY
jgi:hypothetical protein